VNRLLALGFALCLHALASGGEISVRDDRGVSVSFSAEPQRIVSLLPSFTESICALGACARLVGIDRFSNWPPSVGELPRLGGLDDAQIERIVALRPDVVLAARSARVIDRLEALGVKVMVLDSKSQADVQRTLQALARLLGTPEAAATLWARIEREMHDAAARVPPRLRGKRVYFEVDAAPYAAGPGSFVGQILVQLGLANIVPAELGPFPRLNPEFVVRAQPDIVIAPERSLADMAKRPGWASLRALQAGQTCSFASDRYEILIRPGPRMGEAAQLLADCLVGLARRR